jgi:hypothetical protein
MTTHRILRITIAVLASGAALSAQLPDDAKRAADTWLVKGCDEGDLQKLEPILDKFKTQLELYFIQALRNGPDDAQVSAVQAEAGKQYDRIQKTLDHGKLAGLTDADIQAGRAVTRDQYISRAKDDFVLRYRSAAVAGLGVVDGAGGTAALRALANDSSSPLQSSAQAALSRLGEPPKGSVKK